MLNDSSSSSPTSAPQTPSTGFRVALLVLLSMVFLYFFSQLVGSLIISLVPSLFHGTGSQSRDLQNSVGAQFTYGLLVDGVLLLGIAAMLKRLGWTWQTIGLKSPKLRHIILGVFTVVPYYVCLYALVAIVSKFIPSLNVSQKQDLGFNSLTSGLPAVLAFISLVILPPIIEEIAMRGFLYTGLRRWLPKIFAAIAVSVLFGAAHLAEGGSGGPLWIGAIDTFTLSLFLVALRERTGNLWAGITLHMLKNSLAFLSFLLVRLH